MGDWGLPLGLGIAVSSYSDPFAHDVLEGVVHGLIHGDLWRFGVVKLGLGLEPVDPRAPGLVAKRPRPLTAFVPVHDVHCLHPSVLIEELSHSTLLQVKAVGVV